MSKIFVSQQYRKTQHFSYHKLQIVHVGCSYVQTCHMFNCAWPALKRNSTQNVQKAYVHTWGLPFYRHPHTLFIYECTYGCVYIYLFYKYASLLCAWEQTVHVKCDIQCFYWLNKVKKVKFLISLSHRLPRILYMAIISALAEYQDSWLQIYSNLKNT